MNALWTIEDRDTLKRAKKYPELSEVALRILRRMPQPIGQVCGPITSGGVGKIDGNLAIFRATVERLIAHGKNIFDQLPFEPHLFRIRESEYHNGELQLLEEFYGPIFGSGLVTTLYFIQGWESSFGASWEHNEAKRLKIKIIYL